jgi:hypothetical protein
VRRGGPVLFALFVAGTLAGAAPACSNAAKLQGEGGECTQATDCQEGLVCVPQADGTLKCSSDLSSIQKTEEAGAEAAPPKEAGADGTAGDGTAPLDSGAPQDTGTPPQDTGTPPQDTGTPPQDTGTPPQDTGTPPQDSSSG